MNEPTLTIAGNLAADPELRRNPSGKAFASLRVASTPRKFNRETSTWENGEPTFMDVDVPSSSAEPIAEQLRKGMAVVATGHLATRTYVNRAGETRSRTELKASSVGVQIHARQSVTVTKVGGPSGDEEAPF